MFSVGTGNCDSRVSFAILKLLSGKSGGTWRSSPQKKKTFSQGRREAKVMASSRCRALGVDPPERATEKRPRWLMDSAPMRQNSSAAARNSSAGGSKTRTWGSGGIDLRGDFKLGTSRRTQQGKLIVGDYLDRHYFH